MYTSESMSMIDGAMIVAMALYGAALGSFAGAQVWRLRARQLREDKEAGETYNKAELNKLQALSSTRANKDYSRCLHCGHRLQWYDLIPLLSWCTTGGKCRYCKRQIGWFEPLIELATALVFVASYLAWPGDLVAPLEIVQFVVWLLACVAMIVLFAYDARWFLLPNHYTWSLAVLAGAYFLLGVVQEEQGYIESLVSLGGALMILSGLYLLLWWYSGGRWIGFGDVKLGVGLSLLLGQWQLAFLTLFLANLLGAIVAIGLMSINRIDRKAHVPFGPFLIIAAIISVLWGNQMIDAYLGATMRLFA